MSREKTKKSVEDTTPEMEASSDDSSQVTANDVSNEIEEDPAIASINSLLELVDKPETFLHTLLLPPESLPTNASCDDDDDINNSHSSQVKTLHGISRLLFSRMEQLGCLQERLEKNGVGSTELNDDEVGNLSGLTELYVGSLPGSISEEDEEIITVDTETIWGQVDIQNMALFSRLKKTIRKLKKNIKNKEVGGKEYLRLLDSEGLGLDDERQDNENSDEDDTDNTSVEEKKTEKDNGLSDEDEDEDEDDEEDEDEDAKRIKERMERAMADMDNSSDENTDGEDENQEITLPTEKETDLPDPAREELNDGFFDLHEMEEFADQEEEMLPDQVSVEQLPDTEEKMELRRKNLPHLRARNGEEGDSEDEEFDSLMKEVEPSKTRTRFRHDDDINALEIMYEDGDDQDEDDDGDAVNVTAVTFFGQPKKPSKEYLSKLKGSDSAYKRKVKNRKVSFIDEDADEVDSWNDHDFTEGEDWRGKDSEDTEAHQEDDDNSHTINDGTPAEAEKENTQEDIVEKKESEKLSSHAIHAKKLNELTKKLEEEALAEKPWQMIGESKASQRPVNSLLDTTADFEFATKLAPIITVEHTSSIEDVIKQRILAEDWDDVVPRELPDIGLSKRNGELPEVSQEKSKLSLGELYEREYLKKAVGYDADAAERETEEGKAKNEMKMLFANLCSKLDALSNYHFAPRPVADEVDVKTSATPAIAMEEVLPLYVSDARAAAPEEIYGKKKGRESILRGESEMDQSDRTRLRQAKKTARRKERRAKHADEKLISRLQPGLGLNNPYEKRKMREELQMARASGKVVTGEIDTSTEYKTSARFFEKMQADVEQTVHPDSGTGGKRKRNPYGDDENRKSSAFKL